MTNLLQFTERGIYCNVADIYIDPQRSVPKALITHAHSDHARPGSKHYLCTRATKPILLHRLGHQHNIRSVDYGVPVTINGVRISFHPAGHVIGSAQIRLEYKGEVWVVSGDYKVDNDGISGTFEPVPCHTFITESTFALPVYQWPGQEAIYQEINKWWRSNRDAGRTSIISAYSLGKAQRIIQNIDHSIGPVFCHETVEHTNRVIRASGSPLPETRMLEERVTSAELKQALVIAPGNILNDHLMKHVKDYSMAAASGWMAIRSRRRWAGTDCGFVLSDHADWKGLNDTIRATGAERIIVAHGYTEIFARWLREQGYDAWTEKAMYEKVGR